MESNAQLPAKLFTAGTGITDLDGLLAVTQQHAPTDADHARRVALTRAIVTRYNEYPAAVQVLTTLADYVATACNAGKLNRADWQPLLVAASEAIAACPADAR